MQPALDMRHFPKLLIFSTFAMLATPAQGQTHVDLRLNDSYEVGMSTAWVQFDENGRGRAPGGVLVVKIPVAAKEGLFEVRVDTDADDAVEDEASYSMGPDSSLVVFVQRGRDGETSRSLPYVLQYSRNTNAEGETSDTFYWRPRYRVEGVFGFGTCQSTIALLDFDGNGRFDENDFRRGTTVQLDVDNDGRIWGVGEWYRGDQIIEYCGGRFEIVNLDADGRSVVLVESALPVPKLLEPVPSFSAPTLDGKVLSSLELVGRPYLLDFWAAWCSPCVGKFPFLQELERELDEELMIIAINVDEANDLIEARKVIERYELAWPHVMTGVGTADPLWKMFGSMDENRLAIPLYVLVDGDGVIRYAGPGGPELNELADAIDALDL